MNVLLASASPRRKELLESLGWQVESRPSAVDETPLPGEPPAVYTRRVTLAKLNAAPAQPWTLAADTIVVFENTILGKPVDERDARRMLSQLCGTAHDVYTCFVLRRDESLHVQTVMTRVQFRQYSDAEREAYVAYDEWRDKAGAYAIQGRAASFVLRIEGSYTNVVGLPLAEVVEAAQRLLHHVA